MTSSRWVADIMIWSVIKFSSATVLFPSTNPHYQIFKCVKLTVSAREHTARLLEREKERKSERESERELFRTNALLMISKQTF